MLFTADWFLLLCLKSEVASARSSCHFHLVLKYQGTCVRLNHESLVFSFVSTRENL